MFQEAIFALTVKCFLCVHRLPSTKLRNPRSSRGRKGPGWGTSPSLQVQQPHTRGREERGSAAGRATRPAETEHAAPTQLHRAKPTY